MGCGVKRLQGLLPQSKMVSTRNKMILNFKVWNLSWRTIFFLQVTIQLIPISATLVQISIDQRAKTFSIKIKFRLKASTEICLFVSNSRKFHSYFCLSIVAPNFFLLVIVAILASYVSKLACTHICQDDEYYILNELLLSFNYEGPL